MPNPTGQWDARELLAVHQWEALIAMLPSEKLTDPLMVKLTKAGTERASWAACQRDLEHCIEIARLKGVTACP